MKKMVVLLTLMTLTSLFATSSMAEEGDERTTFHVQCDEIPLVLEGHQQARLSLNKKGTIGDGKDFELSVSSTEDYSAIEVEGLNVKVLKTQKFDEFQKSHFGFVRTKSEISVYAVKIKVTADGPIATEIRGCIPAQIKEQDFHLICRGVKTTVLR